jgi:[amino group carrier protein]-lysine/ornithine hydrolase
VLGETAGDGVLRIEDRTPPVRVADGAAARALCAAIRGCGARPSSKLKTGRADLNIVEPRWQVPMAGYAPGDSRLDHTSRQHIDLGECARAIGVVRSALERLADELAHVPVPDRRAAA